MLNFTIVQTDLGLQFCGHVTEVTLIMKRCNKLRTVFVCMVKHANFNNDSVISRHFQGNLSVLLAHLF